MLILPPVQNYSERPADKPPNLAAAAANLNTCMKAHTVLCQPSPHPYANTIADADKHTDSRKAPTLLHNASTTVTVNDYKSSGTYVPASSPVKPMSMHLIVLPLPLAHENKDRSLCHQPMKPCGWHHTLGCCDQRSGKNMATPVWHGKFLTSKGYSTKLGGQ